MSTTISQSSTPAETFFTEEESRALEALRIRFHADHDVFSPEEHARLRFLRWRVHSGRLDDGPSRVNQ